MKSHRASELRLFLEELGIDAKKGLSQNFLVDGNILRKILKVADIQPGDHVLEIGPGPGALTDFLLDAGASVTAVEIDVPFAKALERLQTDPPRLLVVQQDILKTSIETILSPPHRWKVVANLPYHITTPILTRLLPLHDQITSITTMVQKEVGLRLVAQPRTPAYSSLTLFAHFYSLPRYSFTVAPTCFYPRPKVDSAVIHFSLKRELPPVPSEDFFHLTRTAFQQRRKMLRASLKHDHPPERMEAALLSIGLPLTARPEELSLDQFVQLFLYLADSL